MIRTFTAATILATCAALAGSQGAQAQQAGAKSSGKQPAAKQPAAAKAAPSSQDAARKAEILASPEWRRAIFEFSEWLSAQPFYNKQQVEQIKARFNQRVHDMTSEELEYMLADMQAKFQVLNNPQAQEARSWLAQYLAVLSDKKRHEVLKNMPNLATMTAAQLQQEILKIEQKRSDLQQEQAAFQQGQTTQIQAVQAQEHAAQAAYTQAMNEMGSASYSPYRSPNGVNARLNNARIGSGMSYYVGPWGGLGISFSPSSW